MIIVNLSNDELIKFDEYFYNKSEYWISKDSKILTFHGGENGEININKNFLFEYYLLGYKFNCCYAKKVKENLGFGKFIYPELNNSNFYIKIRNSRSVYIYHVDFDDNFINNLKVSD